MKDQVFADERQRGGDFQFDETVSAAFDDMVERSVPFYEEMQRMTCELAADFAVEGTGLYDLGCATGTTLIALDRVVSPAVRFVGLDSSPEMLKTARQKLDGRLTRPYELVEADMNRGIHVENASVVIMILTLQFVRPLYRERLIEQVYSGLNENGCLIIVEKLIQQDSLFNRLFIKHYYEMKRRNGYSDLEIANKREALENVLIPYRMDENRELLISRGFRFFEEFFRWYNFSAMIAVK